MGEFGQTSNIVRISSADLAEPKRGATILIDEEEAWVTMVRTDPIDSMMVIEYTDQQPMEM